MRYFITGNIFSRKSFLEEKLIENNFSGTDKLIINGELFGFGEIADNKNFISFLYELFLEDRLIIINTPEIDILKTIFFIEFKRGFSESSILREFLIEMTQFTLDSMDEKIKLRKECAEAISLLNDKEFLRMDTLRLREISNILIPFLEKHCDDFKKLKEILSGEQPMYFETYSHIITYGGIPFDMKNQEYVFNWRELNKHEFQKFYFLNTLNYIDIIRKTSKTIVPGNTHLFLKNKDITPYKNDVIELINTQDTKEELEILVIKG